MSVNNKPNLGKEKEKERRDSEKKRSYFGVLQMARKE